MSGENSPTLSLLAVRADSSGRYAVVVTNELGATTSTSAEIVVGSAASVTALPAASAVVIGASANLSVAAAGVPSPAYQWRRQAAGTTGFVDLTDGGAYSGTSSSRLTITGTGTAMAGDQFQCVVSNGIGTPATQTFTLTVQPGHSADVSPADGTLNLAELTRVIELYNTRTGTVRTGRYITSAGSVDGYSPDPSVTAGPIPTPPHTADLNRDGRLSLTELTRVIELFNTRTGTARTGAYHVQAGTEDGFGGGP
jgi:hypothetical protein